MGTVYEKNLDSVFVDNLLDLWAGRSFFTGHGRRFHREKWQNPPGLSDNTLMTQYASNMIVYRMLCVMALLTLLGACPGCASYSGAVTVPLRPVQSNQSFDRIVVADEVIQQGLTVLLGHVQEVIGPVDCSALCSRYVTQIRQELQQRGFSRIRQVTFGDRVLDMDIYFQTAGGARQLVMDAFVDHHRDPAVRVISPYRSDGLWHWGFVSLSN